MNRSCKFLYMHTDTAILFDVFYLLEMPSLNFKVKLALVQNAIESIKNGSENRL